MAKSKSCPDPCPAAGLRLERHPSARSLGGLGEQRETQPDPLRPFGRDEGIKRPGEEPWAHPPAVVGDFEDQEVPRGALFNPDGDPMRVRFDGILGNIQDVK